MNGGHLPTERVTGTVYEATFNVDAPTYDRTPYDKIVERHKSSLNFPVIAPGIPGSDTIPITQAVDG